jgi:hypothetical protein
VVEKVERGFTADLAACDGRRARFLVVADGAGGQRRGEIPSPFLQADLEYATAAWSAGADGTRAVPARVEVAADAVGWACARPRSPGLLDLYVRGRKQTTPAR